MIVLTSDDVMPVGRYKGMKVSKIMKRDASYLKNFDDNKVALSDSVFNELGSGMRYNEHKNNSYTANVDYSFNFNLKI